MVIVYKDISEKGPATVMTEIDWLRLDLHGEIEFGTHRDGSLGKVRIDPNMSRAVRDDMRNGICDLAEYQA